MSFPKPINLLFFQVKIQLKLLWQTQKSNYYLTRKQFIVLEKRDIAFNQKWAKVVKIAENSAELAHFILKNCKNESFSFLCGKSRIPDLEEILSLNNILIQPIEIYETSPHPHIVKEQYDGLIFFSPSGVKSYAINNGFEDTHSFCLGQTTAKEVKKFTSKFTIANAPNEKQLLISIKNTLINKMDNNLLIEALKGLSVDRPPVWMMRQAGRYLPDFMKLKEKYDFFTRCRTPELVTEITLMPINQIGVDAAIIFSDILVVLQAMNIEVEMREGIGPFLPNPIKDKESLNQVILPDVHEHLGYVFDAVKLTKKELNNRVPLIGFAGAPWTLFCYALQGQGSKNFNTAKAFCYQHPELAKELLQKLLYNYYCILEGKSKGWRRCNSII